MTNSDKQQIIDEIEKHSTVFRKVSNNQYRIRCPICGDSQKDPRAAHCYIKCDLSAIDEPILYNCFICPGKQGGLVNGAFLKALGIRSDIINKVEMQKSNKITSYKKTDINIITGEPNILSPQVAYIEHRLGPGFTIEDYDKFKIIWDMNLIHPYISSIKVKNTLPSNYDSISFLSDDKSLILTRIFEETGYRWRKITLFNSNTKSFYTIKSTLDLFSSDIITVNIAEGIIDILSVYKNFSSDNAAYIAALGSDYISAIDYTISKGLIGDNVVLNIYIDSDVNETSLNYQLKKYKWIFNSINIHKNILKKDVGVLRKEIKLSSRKI